MKSDISIRAKNLSKKFEKGDEILINISFEIKKGETLGVIGKNGAGKSTLLKILSGTVKPTSGGVELFGTSASILDIGTGFHPELTGLENIYLSARLMGFAEQHIRSKLNEIISFSEIGDYINQPVKIYSNGMFLRLAFSIFALLETEILLIDEVLSVGDVAFKSKSFNMMDDFKRKGKTIVLVSHNFHEIETYCDRVIYLDKEIKFDSYQPRESIMSYMRDYPAAPKIIDIEWKTRINRVFSSNISKNYDTFLASVENELFELKEVRITTIGKLQSTFFHDDEIMIHLKYRKKTDKSSLVIAIELFDMNDVMILCDSECFREGYIYQEQPAGEYELAMIIPKSFLNSGHYYVTLMAGEGIKKIVTGTWHNLIGFEVVQNEWMKKEPWSGIPASLMPKFNWIYL
ncbi:MAG: polysaccharide ABC transporter ATP-binding protein [Bacteroidia bacterium]